MLQLRDLQCVRQLLPGLSGAVYRALGPFERPVQDSGRLLQRLPCVHRGMSDGLPRGRARARLRYGRRADGHGVRHHARAARTAGRRAEAPGGPSGKEHRELAVGHLRFVREQTESDMATVVEKKKKTVRINGCVASAQAAKYCDVDVITAYPIRPYTATMMALAQMVANGELDAEYIVADSEHSQLSIAHGASSSGARVFTGSSGVGVQFAYELYSPISGSRMPVQMMIADRTLDPPGDFGSEHTDALSTRDMGWLMGRAW